MTIQKIKSNIRSRMGQEVVINYSGSRNRKEFYRGTIKEIYDKLFIVKLDNGLKKFSERSRNTNEDYCE